MSRGVCVMYNAWGNVISDIAYSALSQEQKSEVRSDGGKALTTSFVAGPHIRIEETDLVSFQIDVLTKGPLASLRAMVELSFDGNIWKPMTAGAAMTIVGVAPNQVIESEALPFIRPYVIPGDGSGFHMNFELRATYARLLLKGDVAGGSVRARAGV